MSTVEAVVPYTRQVLSHARRVREAAIDVRERSLAACHRSQALLDSLKSERFDDARSAEASNGS
ncbi:MAG: hypothetical protein AAF674_04750 [Pseudomonadota bacterium]